MPILVHLADERNISSIKKNGLILDKHMRGIYCMPVMQNFYVSHQWLRELKRFGGNTFVGVYFKVDSSQKVFAGKYSREHKHVELGEAIKEIQSLEDPLGYELIIDRKIEAKEIQKIKYLPQTIGWRYMPGSNGKYPCGCNYCQKSQIKAKRIRDKYSPESKEKPLNYTEILQKLKLETNESRIETLLWALRSKKRNSDPNELLFLLDWNSTLIDQELALSLKKFKHKNTRFFLQKLLDKCNDDTKEYAAYTLLELYGQDAEELLANRTDLAIKKALTEWKTDQ